MTASAFAIRIGEYTLKFDEKLANKVWRKEVLLHLDSIKIHGELSQENFMTLRYMAMLGDVKGIDLSDCVIEGDSIMDWAFKSDFINGAPRRESESIDDYDKSEPSYGYRANFRCMPHIYGNPFVCNKNRYAAIHGMYIPESYKGSL